MSSYFSCPHCGANVPQNARACPECGSDEDTGWSKEATYVHLLPYKGDSEANHFRAKPWFKYLIAVVAVFVLFAYLGAFSPTGSILFIVFVVLPIGIAYYMTQIAPKTRRSQENQLYRQLLEKAKGDRKLVERLIEYERQRTPDATLNQLMLNAIYRWDRDRR